MKRSVINEIIRESAAFIHSHGFTLPAFAHWSPEHLRARVASDSAAIRDRALGWDVTDYGQGRFDELGLFLFTLRNGAPANIGRGRGMLYAEKLLISGAGQISPMHRHIHKTEDIINRGGAPLVLELFSAAADGSIDETAEVSVLSDGTRVTLPAGGHLRLVPGQSVTLEPDTWHAFWGDGGRVLVGEVSNVNDDRSDNIFRDPLGRFAQVDEDEPPQHLLVSDYDTWL